LGKNWKNRKVLTGRGAAESGRSGRGGAGNFHKKNNPERTAYEEQLGKNQEKKGDGSGRSEGIMRGFSKGVVKRMKGGSKFLNRVKGRRVESKESSERGEKRNGAKPAEKRGKAERHLGGGGGRFA